MRLDELFPSVAAHLPTGKEVTGGLGDPETVLAVALVLRQQQDQLEEAPHLLDQFTHAALSDTWRLRAAHPAVPEQACVVLAMLVGWYPARRGYEYAQPLEMWRWLHSALGAPVALGATTADVDLAAVDRALRSSTWRPLAGHALIMLAPILFHLNTTAHSAQDLAQQLCRPVLVLCGVMLAHGPASV
ncbi:hypothetical protein ABZX65_23575 [Streptomyces sp. NPDC003300]